MTLESHVPARQAERLYQIGKFFLDTNPIARQTGIADRIDRIWITEDMRLPEIHHPKDEREAQLAASNAEANAIADAMPTSIQITTTYSVKKGEKPDEVRIITHTQRVDLGYKIQEVRFDTGTDKSSRKAAANFVMEKLMSLRNRSPEEKNEDKWNEAIRSILLADHVSEIVLDPESIQAGMIKIVQRDNMTGLSFEVPVRLDTQEHEDEGIGSFLFSLEFNLLSNLQQKKFEAIIEEKERIERIVNDYIGS
jgi:hypothetical protein